jgi:hypothetical protein
MREAKTIDITIITRIQAHEATCHQKSGRRRSTQKVQNFQMMRQPRIHVQHALPEELPEELSNAHRKRLSWPSIPMTEHDTSNQPSMWHYAADAQSRNKLHEATKQATNMSLLKNGCPSLSASCTVAKEHGHTFEANTRLHQDCVRSAPWGVSKSGHPLATLMGTLRVGEGETERGASRSLLQISAAN